MISILLMVAATLLVIFLLYLTLTAPQENVIEIITSKSWYYSFLSQDITEKKESFLANHNKYHRESDKKAASKVKSMEKQQAEYEKISARYSSGKKLSVADLLILAGYGFIRMFKLQMGSGFFKNIITSCEQSGFRLLNREQKTGEKRNAMIYATYIYAALISYGLCGSIFALIILSIMLGMGMTGMLCLIMPIVCFVLMLVLAYVPLDSVRNKAAMRKDAIDREIADAVSKLTLLVIAGMNINRALVEVANGSDGVIYRELRQTLAEIGQGVSFETAFMHMQSRCNNRYLDRLISIITKSYTSGNMGLASDLKSINDDCWLEKKHIARRKGEAVANKLFVPTMIMFVGILVIIIIPVLSGLNF